MSNDLTSFTDILADVEEIADSQPLSLLSPQDSVSEYSNNGQNSVPLIRNYEEQVQTVRPSKYAGQNGDFRSVEEIAEKYRHVFIYPYFNLVQSKVIDDALYTDKSMVVCAPTGSGKTVIFEMAIVQLLMELEDKNYNDDFKIIYMAPVKALCTERLTEWHSKFTRLGLLCIEVTGDTDVDFTQLKPYRIIITTPEKWDMLTRRWRDHRSLVEVIKLFLIDEVHILNDENRGPVLEAVVSRMKTIELSAQSAHRIEKLQMQYQGDGFSTEMTKCPPHIRFVAVSATVNNPEDVAAWLGTSEKPAVYYKFGDESRPVKLKRVVEGYPCPEGTSIFKFDIILNYKLWPVIQKYHNGKPTLIFCNTRKSVVLTAEALVKELTVSFSPEQKAKLTALASTIKTKKIQLLVLSGVGCHHAGLLYEERTNIERAFRNRDLPILITTTTLAMGVNLPAHLVIIKNTLRYTNGAYEEYSISTILQMVGRAGRPQFDTEATAVIMTRMSDKPRYQALVGGSEPLQSYLHKRLPENLNSEAALGTVNDVAQTVQWLRSTFLFVRAARDPKWYLGLPPAAPMPLIFKKIEELCVKAINMLATAGLIRMDEASCIESTDAGKLMSIYYLDLETMKIIMKIEGTETLEQLLVLICESHELSDMHLRVDERRCLNTLNRNNAAATIRFPMKGKINSRQMKLNCIIQAVLGCLPIPDPSLNQEAMKVMRIAERICRCLVAYVSRSDLVFTQPSFYSALLNSLILSKCVKAHLWENSPYVSRQLKGIGPTFSTLLATAGKSTLSLLLESHPRDLERIMNKSAPAGNILRKQISLLPQYQITITPIDENRISVQLSLINQSFLAENQDKLTAGSGHSCYVVVGDSENHVLLFTQFIDKDLIGIYNGSMHYEVLRKHSFEHKIFVNCISSKFVGIDAVSEYVFQRLEPVYSRGEASLDSSIIKAAYNKPANKQPNIADVYQERKRKNMDEISQSKEKKRRDNSLMDKIKHLKESFCNTAKEIKKNFDPLSIKNNTDKMQTQMSYKIVEELYEDHLPKSTKKITEIDKIDEYVNFPEIYEDDFGTDDVIVNQHIDHILNDIENEILKNRRKSTTPKICSSDILRNYENVGSSIDLNVDSVAQSYNENTICKTLLPSNRIKKPTRKAFGPPKKRQQNNTNFSFIDSLAKEKVEEENTNLNTSCFSDTIKEHIEKFLQKHKNITSDRNLKQLIETENKKNESESHNIIDLTDNPLTSNIGDIIDLSPDVEIICETLNSNTLKKNKKTCETVQNFRIFPENIHALNLDENSIKLNEKNTIHKCQNGKINENDLIILLDDKEHKTFCMPGADDSKSTASYNDKITTKDPNSEKNPIVTEYNTCLSNNEIQNQSDDFELPKKTVSKIPFNFTESLTQRNSLIENISSFNQNHNKDLSFVSAALKRFNNPTEFTNKSENEMYGTCHDNTKHHCQNNISVVAMPKMLSVANIHENFDRSYFQKPCDENKCRELTPKFFLNDTTRVNELKKRIYVDSCPTVTKITFSHNLKSDIEANNNRSEISDVKEKEKMFLNSEHIENISLFNSINNNLVLTNNVPTDIYNSFINTKGNVQTRSGSKSLKNMNKSVLKYNFPYYTETHLNHEIMRISHSKNRFLDRCLLIEKQLEYFQDANTDDESLIKEKYNCERENDKKILLLPFARNSIDPDYSSCSMNEYSNKRYQNNQYIKRFSYSASKFNVHVQDTRDHEVQIISNVKVNLDVTQIVSKKDEKNNENINRNKSYNNKSPKIYPPIETIQFDNNLHGYLKLQSKNTSKSDSLNQFTDKIDLIMYTNDRKSNTNDTHFELPESLSRPKTNSPTEIQQPNHQPSNMSEKNIICQPSKMSSIDKQSSAKTNFGKSFENNKENCIVNEEHVEAKKNMSSPGNNKNTVKNILQKYSVIFRKSINHIPYKEKQMHEKDQSKEPKKVFSNRIKPMIESLEAKRTRPYTISELHNNPNKLISELPRQPQIKIISNEYTDNTIYSRVVNNINKEVTEMAFHNENICFENNNKKINTPTKEYDYEISQFHPQDSNLPLDYDVFVDEIDNAMFNPKTLLQCYQTESEEMIPPPLQFSDSDNYPSLMRTQTEINDTDDCNGIEMEANSSIFEYDDKEQLTPTKEIETWTLSRDAYETDNINSLKSCTVMRKVSSHNNVNSAALRYSLNNRDKKLSVFKFKHKDKLKFN